MTKRDLQDLAVILAKNSPSKRLLEDLMDFCAARSKTFDRVKFIAAINQLKDLEG